MVWMECAIWELANLLWLKKFSFLCEMDESSSRFRNVWRGKGMCYQFFSEIYGQFTRTNRCYRFFDDGKAKERTRSFCTIEPGGVFNGEDVGLDVQELTESIENKNTKSLNYWLCTSVQEVTNKSGGRYSSRTAALQYCLRLKKWRGRIKYIGCQR